MVDHLAEEMSLPDCVYLQTRIREHWAHALADTGASENVISEELAKVPDLELHLRKQALNVNITDVSVSRGEMFARTTAGSWSALIAIVVLQRCHYSTALSRTFY